MRGRRYPIDTVAAVNAVGEIVSPCGVCRQLSSDSWHTKAVLDGLCVLGFTAMRA